jgi:hypothetical protein
LGYDKYGNPPLVQTTIGRFAGGQSFEVNNFPFTLSFGHSAHPSPAGDVEHHQHAMTTLGLGLSAEPSAHYQALTNSALSIWAKR